jgi:geranylgeranyl diphosphate synthase type I
MGREDSLLVFSSYYDGIQAQLKETINGRPFAFYDMLRYHMGWQDEGGYPCHERLGKLVRPTLCLLSCQAVGGSASQILPGAAALELIHNFSLIHDDIEDASCERHHRPTLWKLWGQAQAINAGDSMFALACLALLRLRENGVAERKIMHCIEVLTETSLQLCEGQYLDILYEDRLDITTADYLNMIVKKTAALIAVSTSLGAYLGIEDEKTVDCFHQFGKELGLAYQVRDDILGVWGTEESTGKSAESDIRRKKKTLPVVYGLENSQGENRKELVKLYSQEYIQGEDVFKVTRILEQLGAGDYAERLIEQHYHRALAHLDATGIALSRQAPLKEAARFLVERDY